MKFTFTLTIVSAILLLACQSGSKNSSGSNNSIDSMFQEWDNDSTPGIAVAVMKDGAVVLSKGYGMADLEQHVAITPKSIFHIASVSKQVTAFCLVLLSEQGKLDLNDDIRKHLPYIHDFGQKITIKNLIHHTSGVRDQWQLLAIQGTRIEDVITTDHVVKLMSMQKALNFDVGSRYMYSNMGYTLMGEIVKSVSGQSLRQFADSAIFKPLQMYDTHFHDDNTEIVKGRTYSYDRKGQGFVNSPLNYATVGATSLFTTVEDELRWLHNFETHQIGGDHAIEQMQEQGVLTNGRKLDYAFGIGIAEHNGRRVLTHSGGDAGYRTFVIHMPQEKLNVALFSNLGDVNTGDLAFRVADVFLGKGEPKKDEAPGSTDVTPFRAFVGHYWTAEGNPLHLYDSGKMYVRLFNERHELSITSDSTLSLWDGYAVIRFRKGATDKFEIVMDGQPTTYSRYTPRQSTAVDLVRYAGRYYSDELDVAYTIEVKDKKLTLQHAKYPDVTLKLITADQAQCPHWWMSNINFNRDSKGKVTGFQVTGGRVLRLQFRKN